MKKLFLSLLLLGSAVAAQAQRTTPATSSTTSSSGGGDLAPSFTIKGGGAYTGFTGDGVDKGVSYRPDYFAGLGISLPVSNMFSVVTEALYTRKGAKFDSPAAGGAPAFTSTAVLQYVDVPLLARVHAGGLFFEVGPQLGVLIDAKQKQDNTPDENTLTNFNVLDFGYVGGLGYESAMGLGIGARYNGGFTSIVKNSAALPASSIVRNSAFQLYLSFTFRDDK